MCKPVMLLSLDGGVYFEVLSSFHRKVLFEKVFFLDFLKFPLNDT